MSQLMSTREITPVPKPEKPFRSKRYLAFIREKPCLGCGKSGPNHAHHVGLNDRAWSRKVSDTQTVPLCAICHDREHNGKSAVSPLMVLIDMVKFQFEYYITRCITIKGIMELSKYLTGMIREHSEKTKRKKKERF